MLKQFLSFKAARQEENDALFLQPGWARPAAQPLAGSSDYVLWSEVEAFLQMAEQALKVRNITNDHLRAALDQERTEKSKVQETSSAAQEESCFLADHLQGLLDERAALKEALEKAQRERDYLARENELLRQELLEGAALGEDSSAAMALVARQQEEARALHSRNAQLENENMQLVARVSALERASTAQQTAMLSCLEESERVRLQQLSISIPESPVTAAHARRGGQLTDDSSVDGGCTMSSVYTGALDLGSDGSYVTCLTPFSTQTSCGGGGFGESSSPGSTSAAEPAALAALQQSARSS